MEDIRAGILQTLSPKLIGGRHASGPLLSILLRALVQKSNQDTFPLIQSPWAAFVKDQIATATTWSLNMFSDALEKVWIGCCQIFFSEPSTKRFP